MKLNRMQLRRMILNEMFKKDYDQSIVDEVLSPYLGLIDEVFVNPATSNVYKEYIDIKDRIHTPEFYPNKMYKASNDPSATEDSPGIGIVIGYDFSSDLNDETQAKVQSFLQLLANNLNNRSVRSKLLDGGDDPKFEKAINFRGKGGVLIYLKHL